MFLSLFYTDFIGNGMINYSKKYTNSLPSYPDS